MPAFATFENVDGAALDEPHLDEVVGAQVRQGAAYHKADAPKAVVLMGAARSRRRGVLPFLDRVVDLRAEGGDLPLGQEADRLEGLQVLPRSELHAPHRRGGGVGSVELGEEPVELSEGVLAGPELPGVRFLGQTLKGALCTGGFELLLGSARDALLTSLVADVGQELLRLLR